jgi:hypothetical protein
LNGCWELSSGREADQGQACIVDVAALMRRVFDLEHLATAQVGGIRGDRERQEFSANAARALSH